ncbi:MAG TPA: hypothetical protein VKT78_15160 [Fimbriimonadaceae bacterium]|nr:hypothetical protein [Fimbriimonadaceae bacterium]
MKSGSSLVRLAWVFLGLLLIGSVAFELGRPNTEEQPYASSFDPSGAAAFAELLRQDGYSVQIDTAIPASISPDRFALAFVPWTQVGLPLTAPAEEDDTSPKSPPIAPDVERDEPTSAPPTIRVFVEHLRKGGMAMVLGYSPKTNLPVDARAIADVVDSAGRTYSVTLPPNSGSYSPDLAESDAVLPAWLAGGQPFANLDQIGGGRAILLRDGEIAMNSFIDQGDNARLLLDQVHLLAPRGTPVEILDGSVSGAAAGLLDVLGPWTRGIEVQLILVAVVVVYSLGKRFGLADETRRLQRSARDLLDGIADTYGRGKAAKAGLSAVLQDADRAVRRELKLPADAPIRKRNERMPPSAAQAMTACEHALMQEMNSEQALALARNLETELDLFLRHRRPAAKRPRRRVN